MWMVVVVLPLLWLSICCVTASARPAKVRSAGVSSAAIQRLQLLASYAGAASCDVRGWRCGPHCEEHTTGTHFIDHAFDRETNTYAYMAVHPRHRRLIVAFRGSVNLASWIQNINALQVQVPWIPDDEARVHRGFSHCYERIQEQLMDKLAEATRRYPGYTLTFIGHSLGGAARGQRRL
ncbi:Alpha/Beta hydrolase protein [Syncephalis pseudoplumigaleata]|uniref:Alpha/Beta hydrolase protein n=1 Tax=Syncephalis pseudoplumigaleata TaxID=1712513 RepID=A0A4P9YWU6_9FUNG|nr:Alpha/Beta hydrolase protein [Syncephalis pseudoplumigaleata]|eukprot:RKP23972.1 Alpha/Beta hydrolase protein [Syncephalis pseudoplumigaleata]